VTVHLTVENKTSGEITVNNVVAEIRGREPSRRMDSDWRASGFLDFGTGAQDNGTGSVSVLEVARAMAALAKRLGAACASCCGVEKKKDCWIVCLHAGAQE